MTHISRTRFKKEIVAEFLPPARRMKKPRVLILAGGQPSVPCKKEALEYWSKRGYFVFFPRYRGTWESGGKFLKQSLTKDILDVIDGIEKGFTDLYSNESIKLTTDQIYVIGGSFGGPAALFASNDPRVTKTVAISPVIDWRAPSPDEPFDWLREFIREAFGDAFRFDTKDWNKLQRDENFYNPLTMQDQIEPSKTFLIHTEDDLVCPIGPVRKFLEQTGAPAKIYKHGGHGGISSSIEPRMSKQIESWFSK